MDSYKLLDDEIYEMSLTLHKITDGEKEYNGEYKCNKCSKLFTRQDNLKKHFKVNCKPIKEVIKQNIINIEKNTNISNIANQTNIENNIIIINQNNMGIKSFDEKWTTEHIDKYIKQLILLSEHKYTNLLTEILKNKENLNVIIDKDSNSGLVYKDESNTYENMKLKEILKESMHKIYGQLQKMFNECLTKDVNLEKHFIDSIQKEKNINDNKYNDYINNTDLKHSVDSLILDIYNNTKIDAISVANEINNKIGY
jgi:hypothetical protein